MIGGGAGRLSGVWTVSTFVGLVLELKRFGIEMGCVTETPGIGKSSTPERSSALAWMVISCDFEDSVDVCRE